MRPSLLVVFVLGPMFFVVYTRFGGPVPKLFLFRYGCSIGGR